MEDKGLDLDLVEQPVPAADLDGLEFVTRSVSTPILADEAVFSERDAAEIIRRGAANLINIKLMKTGGIWGALKICRLAEENRRGVHDWMHAGIAPVRGCGRAPGRGAENHHARRPGRPSLCAIDPYSGGPAFDGPAIAMRGDFGVGVTGVPCKTWNEGM